MTRRLRVLFVGAGPSQAPAIRRACELGYDAYVVDADPHSVGFEQASGFSIGDIRDPDFVAECAARFAVDGITAVATDVSVPATARACARLGFPSISVEGADVSVNKLLQRKRLQGAGLSVPAFDSFTNAEEAMRKARDVGFPAVVKPSDASGSRGVRFVNDIADVSDAARAALDVSKAGTGIIESYIEGKEVSVEGFVVNGIFYELCLSEKDRTPPPYLLDTRVRFPDELDGEDHHRVVTTAHRAVIACGLDNCPVHMELLRGPCGPVVVELAARGAGFKVFTNILPHVTGVDTIAVQLGLALGRSVNIKPRQPLRGALIAFIPPVKGILERVVGLDQAKEIPGIVEAEVYVRPGTPMAELRCGSDRAGHIIAFGQTRSEAELSAAKALSLIRLDVRQGEVT